MYKNLFFDFDGTLFDTYPRMLLCVQKMLKDKRNVDMTYREIFEDCMVTFKYFSDKHNITDEEWEYYFKLLNDPNLEIKDFEPFPGMEELLERLKFHGINCFIYTNRNETTLEYIKKYNFDKYFKDYILSSNKPTPEPLEKMIEKYNLKKEECLVVGDRKLDIDSANNAKVDSFSFNDYRVETTCTYQSQYVEDILKFVFLSKIQGVLFDLENILVPTEKIHFSAWKKVCKEENIPFNEEIYDTLKGKPRKEILKILLKRANIVIDEEKESLILTKKGAYYRNEIDKLDESFIPSDTISILNELKKMNIKIGAISTSLNGEFILKKLGLLEYFDAFVDGSYLSSNNTFSELYLLNANKLGLRPQDILLVEEKINGIDEANKKGFISVGINKGKEYNNSNLKINDVLEVKDIIKRLNNIAL